MPSTRNILQRAPYPQRSVIPMCGPPCALPLGCFPVPGARGPLMFASPFLLTRRAPPMTRPLPCPPAAVPAMLQQSLSRRQVRHRKARRVPNQSPSAPGTYLPAPNIPGPPSPKDPGRIDSYSVCIVYLKIRAAGASFYKTLLLLLFCVANHISLLAHLPRFR